MPTPHRCSNPVLCFDEADKINDNQHGSVVFNVLMALTDSSQNEHFTDKYFTDVEFDMSRCMMVFTYNDESLLHRSCSTG